MDKRVNGYVYIRELHPDEILPDMQVMDNPQYDEPGNLPVTVLAVNKWMFLGVSPTFEGRAWFSRKGWHLVMEDAPNACMWCGEIVNDVDDHESECS